MPDPRANLLGIWVVVVGAIFLGACDSEMVITRKKVKGPVSAVGLIDAGGGEIKYALWGADFLVKSRRNDALEKIAEFCGGDKKYKIVDEVERMDLDMPYTSGDVEENLGTGSSHYKKAQYHHIFFECNK